MNDIRLRTTFNTQARLYDKARPGYPDQLFENIISYSNINEKSNILEIGCGTGKATIPFLKKGFSITAIDIGDNMLKILSKNIDNEKLKIQNISFEKFKSNITFDLIFSATAFHWIPKQQSFSKCAYHLNKNGILAVFRHVHPKEKSGFFAEVQRIYEKHVPKWAEQWAKRDYYSVKLEQFSKEIEDSGYYKNINLKLYFWSEYYTAKQYIDLLDSFSPHIDLEEKIRIPFHNDIYKFIKDSYNDHIEKKYIAALHLCKKK